MKLRTMVVLGSTRTTSPPWGGSPRLGDRVAKFVCAQLESQGKFDIDFVDLLAFKLPLLEQPHHWTAPGKAPKEIEAMAERISNCEAFVLVSPEYNVAMPPALLNFFDHFGTTHYAFKPSAICTYSSGPFGGVRVAVPLRAFTGELGCISVSAMFAGPQVQNSLDEAGIPVGPDGELLVGQMKNVGRQLAWVGTALKKHRAAGGLPQ
jgi:NAD(P)H-dependent FMN reductase